MTHPGGLTNGSAPLADWRLSGLMAGWEAWLLVMSTECLLAPKHGRKGWIETTQIVDSFPRLIWCVPQPESSKHSSPIWLTLKLPTKAKSSQKWRKSLSYKMPQYSDTKHVWAGAGQPLWLIAQTAHHREDQIIESGQDCHTILCALTLVHATHTITSCPSTQVFL